MAWAQQFTEERRGDLMIEVTDEGYPTGNTRPAEGLDYDLVDRSLRDQFGETEKTVHLVHHLGKGTMWFILGAVVILAMVFVVTLLIMSIRN